MDLNNTFRLSFTNFIAISGVVFSLCIGQILFRKVAPALIWQWPECYKNAFNPLLLTALTVYAGATLLWLAVLRKIPLTVAYPFMGAAFIFVPLMAALILKETLTPQMLLGGFIIAAGIYVSSL